MKNPLSGGSGLIRRALLFPSLFFAGFSAASAYPAAPTTWTWNYYDDLRFVPQQTAACTDPDGRLRSLFLDAKEARFYMDGTGPHRVCVPVMQSFRAFSDGLRISEFTGVVAPGYSGTTGSASEPSLAASTALRRPAVAATSTGESTFNVLSGYGRLALNETFGNGASVQSASYSRPMAKRPVSDSYATSPGTSDLLALASAPGPVVNEAAFTVRYFAGGLCVPYLTYRERIGAVTYTFTAAISEATPAQWNSYRVFTGASLAISADRRDFYAMVTSYKYEGGSGAFSSEARVFRVHTTGSTTTSGGSTETILTDPITTSQLSEMTGPATTSAVDAFNYPSMAIASTGQPRRIVYGSGSSRVVYLARHTPGTGGTATENLRTLAGGYTTVQFVFGAAGGEGPAAVMDRLDRLHLTYRRSLDGKAVYHREEANGSFSTVALGGTCDSAPAIANGPGEYPYLVYRGTGPSSTGSHLVVAYPQELSAAYKGDFEDVDNDGRLGLTEFAQSTSDRNVETAAQLKSINLAATITIVSPGVNRFLTGFQMRGASVRQGSTTTWLLADGNDTIQIRPTVSTDGMRTFTPGSFESVDEFTVNSLRFASFRDSANIGPSAPRRFYRLEVTRIQGAP